MTRWRKTGGLIYGKFSKYFMDFCNFMKYLQKKSSQVLQKVFELFLDF